MKTLIIGAGGVGSWVTDEISRCVEQEQISFANEFTLADADLVEVGQVKYQNFKVKQAGMNKAQALAEAYPDFQAVKGRITEDKQLEGYDLIILCVDNYPTRKMVIEYCHRTGKNFLDLRATGKRIFAMPKTTLQENLKFLDNDTASYSCQDKADLEKGRIQLGNKIVALWGVQMLLNILRGHNNKTTTAVI